jgi:hypothetical protein
VGHVAWEEMRNSCAIFVLRLYKGREQLEKPKNKWEYITMDLKRNSV